MRSIKFTEAELEFLVGQYELELIEAEKYIGEIKNILKKLGVISKDISDKNEITKKRGRGRPPKTTSPETKQVSVEKAPKSKIKKKGKPGRPRKRGPKKGSKRKVTTSVKPIESKVPVAKSADVKPAAKKAVVKAKPIKPPVKSKKRKGTKSIPAKVVVEKPAPKKVVVKKASKKKAKPVKKPAIQSAKKEITKTEVKSTVPAVSPVIVPEVKPAEA